MNANEVTLGNLLDDYADYEPQDDADDVDERTDSDHVKVIALDNVRTLEELIGGEQVHDAYASYFAPTVLRLIQ